MQVLIRVSQSPAYFARKLGIGSPREPINLLPFFIPRPAHSCARPTDFRHTIAILSQLWAVHLTTTSTTCRLQNPADSNQWMGWKTGCWVCHSNAECSTGRLNGWEVGGSMGMHLWVGRGVCGQLTVCTGPVSALGAVRWGMDGGLRFEVDQAIDIFTLHCSDIRSRFGTGISFA
jgi:hypothetical protein